MNLGENIKYLILSNKRPIACFAWSSAVRHLKPRDTFIGWKSEKKKKNIGYRDYNTRFFILDFSKIVDLEFTNDFTLMHYLESKYDRDRRRYR